MTTHEKRLQLAIRNHTINVLRECATQTHTDWEKYVKKSEAKAMKEFLDLINQARKEAAIEIRNLYGSPKCEALHHPKKYQHTALEDCPVEKEINALTEQSEESI